MSPGNLYDEALETLEEQDPSGRPAPSNPYLETLDALDHGHTQRMRTAQIAAQATTPDRAAAVRRLASASGLAPEVVERNFDDLRKRVTVDATPYDRLIRDTPKLAGWLEDPHNAALAADDLEPLSTIERTLQIGARVGRALGTGPMAHSTSVWGLVRAGAEWADAPELAAFARGSAQVADHLRTRIRGSQAGAGFVERSVYSGVESLSLSIFSLPALLAGGPAAYLAVLGAVTGGESYTEAREEGLGVGRATAFGAGQGVIEAATELIPAKWFLADLVKQAPLRQVILHQLAGELPGEQAATALQDLNAWATLPSNEHKTVTDYVRERPGRQLETLIATIVAVGGQGAVIRSLQAASGKPHSQHVVEALGEAAEASTTRTRSPEALSALVSQAAEGGLVEVYAPVDTFTEYFSSKGEDPAALAEALTGDPDAYRAAQDGGTDLRIPMSRYVAHAAATEHTAFFGQELRLAPEEMNAREATAFEAALAAQAAEPTQAEAGPAAAVRTQVTAQLEAAGMPAATAARYAALYESTFGAMGERVGVDPVALYESYGLTIRREGLATDPAQQPSAAPDAPAVAPPVAAPVTAPAAQEAAPVAPGAAPTPGMNALHAEYGMEAFAAPAGAPPAAPVGLRDLRLDRDLPLDNRDTIGSMARMRAENPAMFRNMAAREIAFRTTRRGEMAVKEAAYQAGAFDTGAQIEETTPDVPAGPAVAPGVLPESDLGTGPELRDPDPERVAAPGGGAFPLSRARSRARDRAARRVPDSWRDHFLTLHDAALRDGYAGTADDLTDYYLTQVAKATEIANDLAETVADTGWRGLLVEIAALGGISRDKEAGRTGATRLSASVDMLGEFDWLMESLRAGAGLRTASGRHNVKRMGQQQMPRTSAGIKGAPGVLKATGGSSFDDMRDKLESDPRGRWKHYQDLNTFLAEFEDAVRKGHYENQGISIPEAATPSVLGTLEGFLDVRDNTRWWEPADTATSFDPSEFDQSLFDDLLEPPAVDTLETGEQQPRLPGAEAVRETETITPAFEAPFALTSEPATRTGKQTTLFQSAPEGQYRPPAGPSPEAAIAALAARPQAGAPDARAVPFPTLTDLESERLYASRDRIHVRRQAVRLDQIVATQHSFLPAVALDYLATPSEDLPNGIEYGGRVYLAGGHHRTIAAWAQGVHTIEMEVSPVVPELLAEVRTYFQPDDAVPVATLTGTELGEGLTDITDLRQAGLAYYTRALQHGLGAVERPGFGTVTFTNKGKRHVKMYSANPDKLRLIPALPAIIQLGAYGGRTTSYKPRADGFVAFHRFAAPVRLGDRVLQVSVLVGEDAQGNKFYDLDPIKEKARVNPRKQTRGPGPSEDGGTTLDQSIEDTAEDVNLTLLHAPERRGAIRFGADRQFTIDLFARADLSTFLHESGHFFLEVATDLAADVRRVDAAARTPTQIRLLEDYAALRAWLGVEPDAAFTTAHHEQFARGFEAYLMEGTAPSLALRDVFSTFRAWLLGVYRSLRGLNVTLNPDVRAIFDRMLATDAALAEAAAGDDLAPLFTTPESAGMTPEAFARYRTTVADASRIARETLERKLLAEVQRQQEATWQAQRAAIADAVTLEYQAQPVYQALAAMQRGTRPDGAPLEDGVEPSPLKLSKTILVDLFGADRLKRLPRPYVYSAAGGLHPDAVAEMFGYDSADALLTAIEQATPIRVAIEQETTRRMLAAHGALLLDGRLHAEAQAAVANEGREEIVRAELRALGQLRRTVRPFVQAERQTLADERRERAYERRWLEAEARLRIAIAQGHKQTEIDALRDEIRGLRLQSRRGAAIIQAGIPPAGVLRAAARARVEGTNIKDLHPQVFWTAARRAGRTAIARAAAQDFDGAIAAKQQELLNLATYRAATAALADAETRIARAKALATPAARARLGLAGEAYLDQVDGILDRYDFARVTQKALDRRASLRRFVAGLEGDGIPVNLPETLLEETRRIHYREISYAELVGITDGLAQIVHLARLKNRLLTSADKRALDELAATLGESVREHGRQAPREAARDRRPSEERRRAVADFFGAHRKLASILRELDGFTDGGPAWEAIMRPLNEAADREAEMTAAATRQLAALVETAYPGREKQALYVKRYVPAIDRSLSTMERLMITFNWGNEGNRDRVRRAEGWSDQQVQAIIDTLSPTDLEFVQGVLDFLDSYWPEIAAKQIRVFGLAPEKVEAATIRTPHGELRGGYFPLKYDDRLSAKAIAALDLDAANLAKQAAYTHATTKRGHTEARATTVKLPVRMDFGVIFEHLAQVIHDLSHHEALIDVGRILGHTDVQSAILETHGDQVFKAVRNTIRDVAFGDVPATNGFERAMNHVRMGATIAGLGWNLTTSLLQPIGLTNAAVRIGPRWVAKGLGRWLRHPTTMIQTVEWITEVSPFMRTRGRTQQREINEIRNAIGVNTGTLGGWVDDILKAASSDVVTRQVIADSFFFLIQQAQRLADVPTWLGQYEKMMAAGEPEARAIALADQAVLDSQGGGQIKDLSGVQRGGPMLKLWTNFYSYFNVLHNQTVEAHRRTRYRHPAEVGRLAVDYLMLFIVPATLGYAVREALRPDGADDDDEHLLEALVRENLSYLAGTMLGLREASGAIQGYAGYEGPAGARGFAALARLAKQAQQGEIDETFMRALNDTAGILLHYPAGQVWRTLAGIAALAEGRTENPAAVVTGPPRK